MSLRAAIFGALIGLISAGCAQAQDPHRPAVGGIGSPPDAMIFYVAHGAAGACGTGLLRMDRRRRHRAMGQPQAADQRSSTARPDASFRSIIHAWGESNLNVAASLGRILRDHGIDTISGDDRRRGLP